MFIGNFRFIMSVVCEYQLEATDNYKAITSRDYPGNYPTDLTCYFNITSPPGDRILIWFHSFDIEYDYSCGDDYVSVSKMSNQAYYQMVCGVYVGCWSPLFINLF